MVFRLGFRDWGLGRAFGFSFKGLPGRLGDCLSRSREEAQMVQLSL